MRKKDVFVILFPVVIVALLYLVSCATPPPTKELGDAEAAVAAATNQCNMCKQDWCQNVGKPDVEYCGYPCGDAELAAAQAALAKGKALAGEFCHELEARRMLVDAKAKADEARFKCLAKKEAPPPPMVEEEFGLKDIFFDFDKYDIRPDAEPVLQENADVLKNNPNVTMVIEGYADIRGTPAYNLRLAQRRADATKAYLVRQGVDPSRITTASGGETTQFAAGTTEDAYQLNRRAHFIPTQPPSASVPGARIYFKFNDESKPAL